MKSLVKNDNIGKIQKTVGNSVFSFLTDDSLLEFLMHAVFFCESQKKFYATKAV